MEKKFKVWNKKNKKWLDRVKWAKEFCLLMDGGFSIDSNLAEKEGVDVHELKIVFYTGLKDKNGEEIYEGDIIRAKDWGQKERAIGIITYQAFEFVIKKPKSKIWYSWDCIVGKEGDSWEIIGNIYENPGLSKPI